MAQQMGHKQEAEAAQAEAGHLAAHSGLSVHDLADWEEPGQSSTQSLTASANLLLVLHVLQPAQPSGTLCLIVHIQATYCRLPGGALLVAAACCAATPQTPAPRSWPCNATLKGLQ